MRGIERRVEFDGARQMLDAVLHAVTLQGLPFVMSAQEQLIGFAAAGIFACQKQRS